MELALLLGEALKISELPRSSKLAPIFGHLSLEDVFMMVGCLHRIVGGETPRGDVKAEAEKTRQVAAMLADWPHNFHVFLGEAGLDSARTGLYAATAYRKMRHIMGNEKARRHLVMPPSAREILREEILAWVRSAQQGELRGRETVGDNEAIDLRWVACEEAARMFGINRLTLRRLAERQRLTTKVVLKGSRKFLYFDRIELEALAHQHRVEPSQRAARDDDTFLTFKEAARVLGIDSAQVERFCDAKLVHWHEGWSGNRLIERKSVKGLLEAINAKLPTMTSGLTATGVVSASEVVRLKADLDWSTLIAAVRDGKLRPVSLRNGEIGLRQIGFVRQDIARFQEHLRTEKGLLHIYEASRMLRCCGADVPRLVSAGLLLGGPTRTEVVAASVYAFLRDYVSLPMLAKELVTRSHLLEQRLLQRHVRPVHPGVSYQQSCSFWRRSDVENALGVSTIANAKTVSQELVEEQPKFALFG